MTNGCLIILIIPTITLTIEIIIIITIINRVTPVIMILAIEINIIITMAIKKILHLQCIRYNSMMKNHF
ncbi:hypothetical protein BJ944DRAFT_270610 [Cunninghamella echinulata]|nr:hypothetical protein BJ944DRAFT_270610 [Cunninghamella echinulata]